MVAASRVLAEIETLDPQRDCARIVFLSTCYDFPWDVVKALDIATFRVVGVPSISGLMERTGEFVERPQKRYDDTLLILAELLESGYDSERGRTAQRRMNRLHHQFEINNDDYLYVFASNVMEPIKWNRRFGWRLYTEKEKLAFFHLWGTIARRMAIKDVPATLADVESYHADFERRRLRFAPSNLAIAHATREMFAGWYPRPMRPMIRSVVTALVEDEVLDAFGFERPSRLVRSLVNTSLRLRARVLRILPRRKTPRVVTARRHRSYPNGYRVEELGAVPPPWLSASKPPY